MLQFIGNPDGTYLVFVGGGNLATLAAQWIPDITGLVLSAQQKFDRMVELKIRLCVSHCFPNIIFALPGFLIWFQATSSLFKLVLLSLQGHLAHKKQQPPRTLQQAHAYGPSVVLGGSQFLMSKVLL